MALLKVFETSREINFLYLFFLNERNITSPLLMTHLKCVVFHCDNLNSSSINKVYLRAIEFAISISSRFFIYVFFNANFQNWLQDAVCILLNIRMSNFVILKWRPFEYKANLKKMSLKVRSRHFWHIFFKTLCEGSFEDVQINNNWKFQTRPTISHKLEDL